MKNTENNPKQTKVLIDVVSKTIHKLTKHPHLKAIAQTVADSVQQIKVWNNGAGPAWIGEKRLQTDLGDQFIF